MMNERFFVIARFGRWYVEDNNEFSVSLENESDAKLFAQLLNNLKLAFS